MDPPVSQHRLKVGVCVAVALVACIVAAWLLFRDPLSDIPQSVDSNLVARPIRGRLSKPDPPSQGYVGSLVCARCHAEIYESYQKHPMWRSVAGVLEASPIEDDQHDQGFLVPSSTRLKGSLRYYVERTQNRVLHHEIRADREGNVLYDQAVPVRYAIGSGRLARSYLIQRDGILFLSPITWYSEKHALDFSPGYTRKKPRFRRRKNRRFERRITDACLACHAGRTRADRDTPNRFGSPVFAEAAIGCERCHGPGRDHVVRYQSEEQPTGPDTIVNPAKLDPRRRLSVCSCCHIAGIERVLRYGRTDYDFRPGDDLSDIWTVFIQGTRGGSEDASLAASPVEQMRESVCYQRSNGRLGCISCHDSHASPSAENRVAFFRSRCLQCHSQAQPHCSLPPKQRLALSADDSCIDCHMPRLAASHVPHTSQTDHRVLRVPQNAVSKGSQDARLVFFDDADLRMPELEVRRARGLLMVRFAKNEQNALLASQVLDLLLPVLDAADDDLPVLEAIGAAYWLHDRTEDARGYWKRALQLDPDHESVLEQLAILCDETGKNQAGIDYLGRLFTVNRWRHDLYGREAHMLGKLGEFERGIESAKRGLELNPSSPQLHGWLAETYELTGEKQLSRYHRKMLQNLSRRR